MALTTYDFRRISDPICRRRVVRAGGESRINYPARYLSEGKPVDMRRRPPEPRLLIGNLRRVWIAGEASCCAGEATGVEQKCTRGENSEDAQKILQDQVGDDSAPTIHRTDPLRKNTCLKSSSLEGSVGLSEGSSDLVIAKAVISKIEVGSSNFIGRR